MNFEIVEETTNPAVIKVIGAGGGGSNAVNRMMDYNLKYVDFIVVNTDLQALNCSKAPVKIPIGSQLTGGLGAGGDPEVGEKAALEDKEAVSEAIKGSDMLFITAGMGGGTGTGSAPVIAKIAKELGILTVAIVTKPFIFEGRPRMKLAEEGIKKLREHVDAIIVLPNQNLYKALPSTAPLINSFEAANEVLRKAVQGISSIIYDNGTINVDLADVRTAMKGQGTARMGIGVGEGPNRAVDAATNAINNPLLEEAGIDGAKNLLVNIYGSKDLALDEIEDIMNLITMNVDKDVKVFLGVCVDESMKDKINVIVIATGFESETSERTEVSTNVINTVMSEPSVSGDFISAGEWTKMNKLKQPTLPGLVARNETEVNERQEVPVLKRPVLDFKLASMPTESDLEKPAYYRYAK